MSAAKDWEIVKRMLWPKSIEDYGLSLSLSRWKAACEWAKAYPHD